MSDIFETDKKFFKRLALFWLIIACLDEAARESQPPWQRSFDDFSPFAPIFIADRIMQEQRTSYRRQFLSRAGALGLAAWYTPGVFAEELLRTPRLTEGPFYPNKLPLDQDNDLIVLGNSLTPAVGIITHLTGRILTRNGSPVRGATMEIWQCDANEVYLHTNDSSTKQSQQDRHFQGFGRFETSSSGSIGFVLSSRFLTQADPRRIFISRSNKEAVSF